MRAVIAGATAGAALGLVQWLVLKSRLPSLSIWWVAATSIGFAIGLAMGTAFMGSETTGNELLWRGAIIAARLVIPLFGWVGIIPAIGLLMGVFE